MAYREVRGWTSIRSSGVGWPARRSEAQPKPEGSTLSGYARNLKKECAGLVAGQAVLTAEIRTVDFYSRSSFPQCHRSSYCAPQDLIILGFSLAPDAAAFSNNRYS